MKFPNIKITNYVEQHLDGELLLYNLSTNQAYCLNETSAAVFNACNGATTFNELERQSGFSSVLIFLTLDELKRQNLIEDDYISPLASINRREAIKRVGLASLIALPVVTGLIAPMASQAASGCVNTTGPQRARNTFLGYRSPVFCANDANTCCSNSTRYDPDNFIEINNVTHQLGYACYCN